jgi:hypothetical protein
MSKATLTKIEASAAFTQALAQAIAEAKAAGLSAGDVLKAIEPITDHLANDED